MPANTASAPLVEARLKQIENICDLSRDNVPNASRSKAEQNDKGTGDEQLGKPFKTGAVNGWTAN